MSGTKTSHIELKTVFEAFNKSEQNKKGKEKRILDLDTANLKNTNLVLTDLVIASFEPSEERSETNISAKRKVIVSTINKEVHTNVRVQSGLAPSSSITISAGHIRNFGQINTKVEVNLNDLVGKSISKKEQGVLLDLAEPFQQIKTDSKEFKTVFGFNEAGTVSVESKSYVYQHGFTALAVLTGNVIFRDNNSTEIHQLNIGGMARDLGRNLPEPFKHVKFQDQDIDALSWVVYGSIDLHHDRDLYVARSLTT